MYEVTIDGIINHKDIHLEPLLYARDEQERTKRFFYAYTCCSNCKYRVKNDDGYPALQVNDRDITSKICDTCTWRYCMQPTNYKFDYEMFHPDYFTEGQGI